MEFAVTTAMMAILAATAAPKLSILSENAKMAKSKDELDKLAGQALNFFQEAASVEGVVVFPVKKNIIAPLLAALFQTLVFRNIEMLFSKI